METIIGSLNGLASHTFDTIYDLFFTTDRVIAVIIQHPGDVPSGQSSLMTLIFGNLPEKRNEQMQQRRISRERRKASQDETPDELLVQNPLNFAIPYSEITSLEIKHELFQWQLRLHVSNPANVRQLNFTINKNQIPEARRILESVLHSKLKGK
jgi:hypothetical protein